MSQEKETCFWHEVGYSFESEGERRFARNEYVPHYAICEFINRHPKGSLFATPYRYDRKIPDKASLYGFFYLDFDTDSGNDFEKVREDARAALSYLKIVFGIYPEHLNIFFSGSKGIHITVPPEAFSLEPTPILNGIWKTIATAIKAFTPNKTVDTKIYDNKRLFRLPNTWHDKSGLYKVQLSYDQFDTMSYDEIREYAKTPRQLIIPKTDNSKKIAVKSFKQIVNKYLTSITDSNAANGKRGQKKMTFTPPCIAAILEDGAPVGERNVTIACLAGFYKSSGKTIDESIALISDWNKSKNILPTPERELVMTTKSLFQTAKTFGCTTLKELSRCSPHQCRIHKKEENKDKIVKEGKTDGT